MKARKCPALDRAFARLAVLENALTLDDDTGADLTIDSTTREGLLIVLGDIIEDVSKVSVWIERHGPQVPDVPAHMMASEEE